VAHENFRWSVRYQMMEREREREGYVYFRIWHDSSDDVGKVHRVELHVFKKILNSISPKTPCYTQSQLITTKTLDARLVSFQLNILRSIFTNSKMLDSIQRKRHVHLSQQITTKSINPSHHSPSISTLLLKTPLQHPTPPLQPQHNLSQQPIRPTKPTPCILPLLRIHTLMH
jgi:hypothetical protein